MRDYVAPSVHFLVDENCLRRPALLHEDHAEGKVSASAAPVSRFSSSRFQGFIELFAPGG